ncbi:hypothetical protein [Enteroscipio rubneri]|uniref:hypothetical protein n=1 Tax=Enteroscipio rubneri TaxID=2070686 RepID=UPI00320B2F8C
MALRTFKPMIDRLCLLLANASSALVARRVKGAIMELWAAELGAGAEAALAGDARIVLEFVVNGILGLMAYRAETGMRISVEEIARVPGSRVARRPRAYTQAHRGGRRVPCLSSSALQPLREAG